MLTLFLIYLAGALVGPVILGMVEKRTGRDLASNWLPMCLVWPVAIFLAVLAVPVIGCVALLFFLFNCGKKL